MSGVCGPHFHRILRPENTFSATYQHRSSFFEETQRARGGAMAGRQLMVSVYAPRVVGAPRRVYFARTERAWLGVRPARHAVPRALGAAHGFARFALACAQAPRRAGTCRAGAPAPARAGAVPAS